MAPATELARPPRIPKLTYRNRLPADQSSLSSQTTSTDLCSSDTPGDMRLSTPTSTLAYEFRSTASSKSTSLASSNGSVSHESKASSKKKKNGVLNFLTLKEPSQIALQQFAESQRKQTAIKGGDAIPTGLQGISLQKLPPNVPKVNSKWDGVPDSLKSSRNSTTSSKRSSSSSQESPLQLTHGFTLTPSALSVITNDSRGPPNSLASPEQSTIDVSERKDSRVSESLFRFDSSSTSSLPEMTNFFPVDPSSTSLSLVSQAEHPWSPHPPPLCSTVDTSVVCVSQSDNNLAISEEDMVDDEVDAIFRRLKGEARGTQESQVGTEEDESDVPGTHDFLFEVKHHSTEAQAMEVDWHQAPPSASASNIPAGNYGGKKPANFSRLRPNSYSHHHRSPAPALPTLYEVSIASTDDTVTDSVELDRTNMGGSSESSTAPSIVSSTSPSIVASYTPSVMSASWYRSPRERLGLGGRVRKNDVLPWERQAKQAHLAESVRPPIRTPGRDDNSTA